LFNPAHLGVEILLERIVEVNDLLEMCPTQFSPQCGDNLFPISRSLLSEDVLPDTLADSPVQNNQHGVHLPCLSNQLSEISEQDFWCDCYHSSLFCTLIFFLSGS